MIPSPSFARVAEAFGCAGRHATSQDDLARAVREFLADDRPYLVDARISQDVLSESIRRLRLGEDVYGPLL